MLVNNPSCFSKCFKISYVLKIQIGNILPVPAASRAMETGGNGGAEGHGIKTKAK